MNRRNILRTAATFGTVSAIPFTTSAANEPDSLKSIVENSAKIRQQQGREAALDFIKSKPVSVSFTEYQLDTSLATESGEVSTEELDTGKNSDDIKAEMGIWSSFDDDYLSVTMSIYYNLALHTVSSGWAYNTIKAAYGENPRDATAFTWNTDMWTTIDSDRFEATSVTSKLDRSDPFETGRLGKSTGKAAFRVNDREVSENWNDPEWWECVTDEEKVFAGQSALYLRPSGNYSRDERLVKGAYTHCYDGSSPNVGASLSVPYGASISVSSSEENIKTNELIRDKNGDEIEVYQSETELK